MDALDCIYGRRSIRNFTEEPVSHEVLEKIVEAASYSPSWKHTQVVHYVAIDDSATKDRIAKECTSSFVYNGNTMSKAPMLVAITALKGRSGIEKDGSFTTDRKDTWLMFDAGCAAQTFCLAAHAYGLGTVIMGIFDDDKIIDLLQIPDDRELVNIICIGHPAESPEAPKRKSISDLLIYK
ncbi:MAG: nitroreductase family protein [Lachnospiraceae bacterium]|nr:nitroreductase family protein [Lachnospiraceae bacterium]